MKAKELAKILSRHPDWEVVRRIDGTREISAIEEAAIREDDQEKVFSLEGTWSW